LWNEYGKVLDVGGSSRKNSSQSYKAVRYSQSKNNKAIKTKTDLRTLMKAGGELATFNE
jgi:hypothetical protein